MLEALKTLVDGVIFIVSFIAETFVGIFRLLTMFADSIGLVTAAIGTSPTFLGPILYLILAVAVLMWVVNLL